MTEDPQALGEAQKRFALSEFGQHVLIQIDTAYNDALSGAQQEGLTGEQKAFLVERAAGVKKCIDILTANAILIDSGTFDDDKPKAATTKQ